MSNTSLFSARQWWHTLCAGGAEEFDGGALVVSNLDNAEDGNQKIAVASLQGVLRVYAPAPSDASPEELLLEAQLGAPVLQLAVGRLGESKALSLIVLHPRALAIFQLKLNEAGGGLALAKQHEHRLGAPGSGVASFTASSMVVGPFGHADLSERSRSGAESYLPTPQDHVCVQSMDGQLAFYIRGTLAFVKQLPDVLLPGPLAYCTASDSFFTCNSGMVLECYRWNGIAAASSNVVVGSAASGVGARARGVLQPAWRCILGERARSLREMQLAAGHPRTPPGEAGSAAAAVGVPTEARTLMLVVGERALFGFDAQLGTLVMHKRLAFEPTADVVYRRSAAMEPADDNLLIASTSGSLSVFHSVQLDWCARLPPSLGDDSVLVAVAVGRFAGVNGLVATLTDTGALSVLYMGTKPPDGTVGSGVNGAVQLGGDVDAMDAEWRELLDVIRASKQHTVKAGGKEGEEEEGKGSGGRRHGPLALRLQVPAVLDVDAPTGAAEPSRGEENAAGEPARYRRGAGPEARRVIQATVFLHLKYNARGRSGHGPLPPFIDVSVSVKTPPFVLLEDRQFSVRVRTGAGERSTAPIVLRCRAAALDGDAASALEAVPSSCEIELLAVYEDAVDVPSRTGSGVGEQRAQLHTARCTATLPFALLATATAPIKLKPYKLTLGSNRCAVQLATLFEELLVQPGLSCSLDAPQRLEAAAASGANVISFAYCNGAQCTLMGAKVSASKTADAGSGSCRYRLQATRLDALWLVAQAFAARIAEHFAEPANRVAGESPFALQYADPLPLVDVFKLIDERFGARRRLQTLLGSGAPDAEGTGGSEEREAWGELGDRAAQFRLVQKRLLVRYKERMPTPLACLDGLLSDSYHGLLDVANAAEATQRELRALTQSLTAAMRLLLFVVKLKCELNEGEGEALRAVLEVEVDEAEIMTGGRVDEGGGWEERAEAAAAALYQEWFGKGRLDSAPMPGRLAQAAQNTEALKSRLHKLCEKLQRRATRARRT